MGVAPERRGRMRGRGPSMANDSWAASISSSMSSAVTIDSRMTGTEVGISEATWRYASMAACETGSCLLALLTSLRCTSVKRSPNSRRMRYVVAGPLDWLAPVHGLDADQLAEPLPQRGFVNRVRVCDEGPAASGDFLQSLDDVSLVARVDPGRGMDRQRRLLRDSGGVVTAIRRRAEIVSEIGHLLV